MPLFLVVLLILVTTFRHEGSHALAALLQGVELKEVRLLPGIRDDVGFYFGYVIRGDGGTWLIEAAPYFSALVWAVAGYFILINMNVHSRFWLPAVFVGLASPLVDLAYNYQGGLWREGTDVFDLLASLPPVIVHLYFIFSIALCIFLLRRVLKFHKVKT